MRLIFILSLILIQPSVMASTAKKPKIIKLPRKLDLGLVRKSASIDTEFKPETDPNKRGIEKERYTHQDQLDWQNSDALSAQKTVSEGHTPYQQQQMLDQALQNLPRISIPTHSETK